MKVMIVWGLQQAGGKREGVAKTDSQRNAMHNQFQQTRSPYGQTVRSHTVRDLSPHPGWMYALLTLYGMHCWPQLSRNTCLCPPRLLQLDVMVSKASTWHGWSRPYHAAQSTLYMTFACSPTTYG